MVLAFRLVLRTRIFFAFVIALISGPQFAYADDAGSGTGGVVTVTYRQKARELAVTWDGPKRGTVSRVVSAPSKIDDVVRDAAMLAGNLARDEADELVAPAPPPLPPSTPPEPSIHTAASPPPSPSRALVVRSEEPRPPKEREDLTLGVFYPLSTNIGRPWVRTSFDFNLLFSRVGQLDGFQLGGVNVITRAEGKGTGDASGVQIGYGANIATGRVEGVQIAPFVNIAGKSLDGWQTAFVVNRVGGDLNGLQLTWGLNSAAGSVSGVQLGALNLAGDVRGAQLGLINVGHDRRAHVA